MRRCTIRGSTRSRRPCRDREPELPSPRAMSGSRRSLCMTTTADPALRSFHGDAVLRPRARIERALRRRASASASRTAPAASFQNFLAAGMFTPRASANGLISVSIASSESFALTASAMIARAPASSIGLSSAMRFKKTSRSEGVHSLWDNGTVGTVSTLTGLASARSAHRPAWPSWLAPTGACSWPRAPAAPCQTVYSRREEWLRDYGIDIAAPHALYRDLLYFGPPSLTQPEDRSALLTAVRRKEGDDAIGLHEEAARNFDR